MTIDKQRPQLRFILNGFTQDKGFRRFAFQSVDADRSRTDFTVQADLGLIRMFGIHTQDLPLLCRELLERRADSETIRAFTFTEDDMRKHRADLADAKQAAARKKRVPRAPAPGNIGGEWRPTFQFSLGSRA